MVLDLTSNDDLEWHEKPSTWRHFEKSSTWRHFEQVFNMEKTLDVEFKCGRAQPGATWCQLRQNVVTLSLKCDV